MGGPTIKKWKSGRVHEPWTLPSSGPPPLSIIFFPITRHANLYNINLLKISLYFDFFLLQHLFFFWKKKEAASLVYLYFPFTMNTAIINEKKNKSNFFSPCFTSPPPPPATPTNNHLVIFASVPLPFYINTPSSCLCITNRTGQSLIQFTL